MKYITILNLVAKTLFTMLVFAVVREKSDYVYQPLLTSLGCFLSGGIAMFLVIKRWGMHLYIPSWRDVFTSIKGSADIFVNQIVPNLYNSLSIVLVGVFNGSVATGLYDAGSRVAQIETQFIMNISRVFFPFLANRIDKHKQFAFGTIVLAVTISLMTCLLAEPLILFLFGAGFRDSISVLRIQSLTVIFTTIYTVYGVNYMILEGYERSLRRIRTAVSLFSFLFAIPLAYYYSFIGASITILLANVLLGCITMRFVLKRQKTV